MIAKQYLITGMFMGVIGVFMSLLFRLQLVYPDQSFSIIEAFLGKGGEGGQMTPDMYMGLVTIHGTIMVFFVLTAGLSGTFSNLLIPLQIGARDMASGFLNMISYWLFFLSSLVMFISIFVHTGPAAAGWTVPRDRRRRGSARPHRRRRDTARRATRARRLRSRALATP
mgnify:CR=1 FL=1